MTALLPLSDDEVHGVAAESNFISVRELSGAVRLQSTAVDVRAVGGFHVLQRELAIGTANGRVPRRGRSVRNRNLAIHIGFGSADQVFTLENNPMLPASIILKGINKTPKRALWLRVGGSVKPSGDQARLRVLALRKPLG